MNTNPTQSTDKASWLNLAIPISVSLTAGIMAVSQVVGGNVQEAAVSTKQEIVDQWSFYQAKSIKQYMHKMQVTLLQLNLARDKKVLASPDIKHYKDIIREYENDIDRYEKEKNDIFKTARGKEKENKIWNKKDDKFDMSNALFAMSLSLMAITALTKFRPLFFISLGIALTATTLVLQAFIIK